LPSGSLAAAAAATTLAFGRVSRSTNTRCFARAAHAGNKAWRAARGLSYDVDVIDDGRVPAERFFRPPQPKKSSSWRTVIVSRAPPCLRAMQTPSKACKRGYAAKCSVVAAPRRQ